MRASRTRRGHIKQSFLLHHSRWEIETVSEWLLCWWIRHYIQRSNGVVTISNFHHWILTQLHTQTHTTWYSSDRASWIDYILITNLMHWLLFIHKILFSSTCFEPQVLIFRRLQLYTCSIWYCHSLREFLVACRCCAACCSIPLHTERTHTHQMLCCRITTLTFYIFNKF